MVTLYDCPWRTAVRDTVISSPLPRGNIRPVSTLSSQSTHITSSLIRQKFLAIAPSLTCQHLPPRLRTCSLPNSDVTCIQRKPFLPLNSQISLHRPSFCASAPLGDLSPSRSPSSTLLIRIFIFFPACFCQDSDTPLCEDSWHGWDSETRQTHHSRLDGVVYLEGKREDMARD